MSGNLSSHPGGFQLGLSLFDQLFRKSHFHRRYPDPIAILALQCFLQLNSFLFQLDFAFHQFNIQTSRSPGRDVPSRSVTGRSVRLEVFDPAEHGPLYAEQAGPAGGRRPSQSSTRAWVVGGWPSFPPLRAGRSSA